jgi:hypothetical protein
MRPSHTTRSLEFILLTLTLLALGFFSVCPEVEADTVRLKNGSRIDGTVISETASEVILKIGRQGTLTLRRAEIAEVEKNGKTGETRRRPVSGKPTTDVQEKARVLPVESKGTAPESVDARRISKSLKNHLDSPLIVVKGKQKAQIDQWVRDLQRQRVNYRTRAEKKLRSAGLPVVAHLQEVACSDFVRARIGALRILIEYPRYESMQSALSGLRSEDPWVRKLSAELAGKISGKVLRFAWEESASVSVRARQITIWSSWFTEQERLKDQIMTQREQKKLAPMDRKNSSGS